MRSQQDRLNVTLKWLIVGTSNVVGGSLNFGCGDRIEGS